MEKGNPWENYLEFEKESSGASEDQSLLVSPRTKDQGFFYERRFVLEMNKFQSRKNGQFQCVLEENPENKKILATFGDYHIVVMLTPKGIPVASFDTIFEGLCYLKHLMILQYRLEWESDTNTLTENYFQQPCPSSRIPPMIIAGRKLINPTFIELFQASSVA